VQKCPSSRALANLSEGLLRTLPSTADLSRGTDLFRLYRRGKSCTPSSPAHRGLHPPYQRSNSAKRSTQVGSRPWSVPGLWPVGNRNAAMPVAITVKTEATAGHSTSSTKAGCAFCPTKTARPRRGACSTSTIQFAHADASTPCTAATSLQCRAGSCTCTTLRLQRSGQACDPAASSPPTTHHGPKTPAISLHPLDLGRSGGAHRSLSRISNRRAAIRFPGHASFRPDHVPTRLAP
jgi:hypothetical protein